MHRIYRGADEVAIWLGQHGEDKTPLGMDVLSWISMPPVMGFEEQSLQDLPALNSRLAEHPHPKALHLGQLRSLASVISQPQHIRVSQEEFQRLGLPQFDDPLWQALGVVLSRPWLFRLWTFQEMMLGQKCFVAYGDSRLLWRTYFDAGMRLSLCGLLDHCLARLPRDHKERALTAFTRLKPFCAV